MMQNLILSYMRNFPMDYGKGYLRKFIKLPADKESLVRLTNSYGITYKLSLKDHVMREVYINGVYEKNTIRQLRKLISPSMTFFDIGANIGTYSLTMAKFLPQGKVYSFEPNPRTRKFFQQNITLNGFKNIEVIPVGLSDKEEVATLYTPSLTQASLNKHQSSAEQETIQLTTLDRFCDERKIEQIDILKIDVEGHEVKCLMGALNVIKRSKKLIMILEIDDNCLAAGHTKQSLFDMVINMGFRAYLPKGYPFPLKGITAINEKYSDNIIFIKS